MYLRLQLFFIFGICAVITGCDDSSDGKSKNTAPRTGGINGITFYSAGESRFGYDESIGNNVTISVPENEMTTIGVKVEQSHVLSGSDSQASSSSATYVAVYSEFIAEGSWGLSVHPQNLGIYDNVINVNSAQKGKSAEQISIHGKKAEIEEPLFLHSADVDVYPWIYHDFSVLSVDFMGGNCSYGFDGRAQNQIMVSYDYLVNQVNNIFRQGITGFYGRGISTERYYYLDPHCDGSLEMWFDVNGNLLYNDQLRSMLNDVNASMITIFHVPQINIKLELLTSSVSTRPS